jgi:cofilin
VFKIKDDLSSIELDKASSSASYSDFIETLPKDGCRFAVYDFEYSTPDGPRNKLLFYTWYVWFITTIPRLSEWELIV